MATSYIAVYLCKEIQNGIGEAEKRSSKNIVERGGFLTIHLNYMISMNCMFYILMFYTNTNYTTYTNYRHDGIRKDSLRETTQTLQFSLRELWLIIMLKSPLLSTVSYLHPADYDNVVRFELRGKFSKGRARPRINMEELDWRKERICSPRPQLTRKRNAKLYRMRNVARTTANIFTFDFITKGREEVQIRMRFTRLIFCTQTLKYNYKSNFN